MGSRSDGQLGSQPQNIRRDALVHCFGPDGVLIAIERSDQQRAHVDATLVEAIPHAACDVACASGGEIVARPEDQRAQHGER